MAPPPHLEQRVSEDRHVEREHRHFPRPAVGEEAVGNVEPEDRVEGLAASEVSVPECSCATKTHNEKMTGKQKNKQTKTQ
jgi:hypothetical protein